MEIPRKNHLKIPQKKKGKKNPQIFVFRTPKVKVTHLKNI